jgi:UDP-N-acetylmuramate dehydrogenase
MNQNVAKELAALTRGKVLQQVPLSRHTSLRVGGCADLMMYPVHHQEVLAIIRFCAGRAIPRFIMGAGTNLLVRDGGIRGVVIKLTRSFITIAPVGTDGDQPMIQAEAGASLRRLLAVCLEQELAGLEFLSGIPGSLGGAWAMNAGAQGTEMGDVTEAITLLTPRGELEEKKSPGLPFAYRSLGLAPGTVILKGLLRVRRGTRSAIAQAVETINRRRWQRQPLELPSAGCVFKNPPGDAAGRLIEQAGLKGRREGGAQISDKHANFIVNRGGATARDILTLMDVMQKSVLEATGIRLEPELQVVGDNG